MSYVSVLSLGKASGSTTVAMALAAAAGETGWLVELDPSGGDLAGRWGRSVVPGVLAATAEIATKRSASAEDLMRNSQDSPFGGRVMMMPPTPESALEVATEMGARWGLVFTEPEGWVIADAGRWWPSQAGADRVRSAGAVVAVVSGSVAGVERARTALPILRHVVSPAPVTVVLAPGPRTTSQVADVLKCDVVNSPFDQKALRRLEVGQFDRRTQRSPMVRFGRSLLDDLADAGTWALVPASIDSTAVGTGVRDD